MRNYLALGPVRIRINSKHLAGWGYPSIQIGALSLFINFVNLFQFLLAFMGGNRN